MKKFLLILLPLFFLSSCNNTVPYEIRNTTDYDVTLYDTKHVDRTEYFVEAHTILTIDHTKNAELELKNNTDPIEVYNNFIYTEIKELKSYRLNIYNNSNKTFILKILNTTHDSTASFTINTDVEQAINIYCNSTPEIELYFNNKIYNNYVIRDNNIIIY